MIVFKKISKITLIIPLILVLLILGLIIINKVQKTQDEFSYSPPDKQYREYSAPFFTSPPQTETGEVDYESEKVKSAIKAKETLSPSLPISETEFETSVEINTTIFIYALASDPDYLIHIDIHGIDYGIQETDPDKNPNVTAFIESFNKTKALLEENGVEINEMLFVFGGRQYIQETAELWIKTFDLL